MWGVKKGRKWHRVGRGTSWEVRGLVRIKVELGARKVWGSSVSSLDDLEAEIAPHDDDRVVLR